MLNFNSFGSICEFAVLSLSIDKIESFFLIFPKFELTETGNVKNQLANPVVRGLVELSENDGHSNDILMCLKYRGKN